MHKVLMALRATSLATCSLFAQQVNAPPTGLHVLSATLDLKTLNVTVQLKKRHRQNRRRLHATNQRV